MALLTIRDPRLGTVTWEPPEESPAAILLADAEGRNIVEADVKRFLYLYTGILGSGPVAGKGLEELDELISMLARIQSRRLKQATQN